MNDLRRNGRAVAAVRQAVFDRDGHRCIDCGPRAPRLPESLLEADHDRELADDGTNDPNNYVTRCLTHHDQKTQERRMARQQQTQTRPGQTSARSRGSRAMQTAQLPDKPAFGAHARPAVGVLLIAGGGWLVARALGFDARAVLTVACAVAAVCLLTYGARLFHWHRLVEAQRVFEVLAKVADLPYAARTRAMKVRAWSGTEPRAVQLRYGRGFDAADEGEWARLRAALATALSVPVSEVHSERGTKGRAYLYVGDAPDEDQQPETRAPEPESVESAPPPADLDQVTVRVRDALAGVLGDDCTVRIDAWWPNGAPRAGFITYPSRATRTAREARADLPTVMGDAFAPCSEHGLWQFTWEPTRDRFRFADVPDSLAPVVPLADVDPDVDLRRGVILGVTEDGRPWRQPILEDHLLVAGTTGAGKGSILWGIVRALSPLVADGRCLLYVSDPKGGMEFGQIKPIAHRFTLRDGTAAMLEEAVEDMIAQQRRLSQAGARKLEAPTRENPLRVIIVDELANFAGDKDVAALMATLLQQGRAVGVVVIGALQDARVKAIDNRDLFKSAIAMRLRARSQVDMVLGAGMRAAGAVCDRIPKPLPGIGYVVTEDQPDPVRVRAAFVPDNEIARLTARPERAPEHGTRAQIGEQLALDAAPRGGEPVQVGEVIAPALAAVPDPTPEPARAPVRIDQESLVGNRVLLPGDEDPVRITGIEPDEDEPDARVEVTYIYDGEEGERVCSFDRDDRVTLA